MTPVEKHIAAIKSDAVDKSTIAGLRKAINAMERRNRGWSIGHTATHMTDAEFDYVTTLLMERPPRIVGALHDSGVALLKSKRYRRQLAGVMHVVDDLKEFRLVGFEYVGRHLDRVTPVYRAINSRGNYFDYTNLPWQAGGNGPQVC